MKNFGWATFAALMLAVGGCGSSDSSSAATATAVPAKIIAHDVDNGSVSGQGFDLVVGHSHHVLEASTDEHDARMIIHARAGKIETFDKSPAGVINEMYAKDTYRHFGNSSEPPAPSCTVSDQEAVEVDNYDDALLNGGQPHDSVSCKLADGTVLYVSAWQK